jgi:polyphosphate kinase
VFYFVSGDKEMLYLSSADWMNRNMLRRVELAWPVEDAALRTRIINECLLSYLHDNVDAWILDADGHYKRAQPSKSRSVKAKAPQSAQAALKAMYSAKV